MKYIKLYPIKRKNLLLIGYSDIKKIVFLDEFPWFVTSRSDFVAAFGEFWNRRGTEHQNYMFIICGSATSWIIQNVLDNTGSLYNRVTSQIFLSPFTLKEAELFFSDREYGWAKSQILECQMIFGGLPYFMDLLNRNESLRQNVDRLLFRQNALLSGEFSRLLEATLKKSPVYHRILEYLSHFRYGALKSECKEKLDIPDGSFSRTVDDLTKCGYVSEYKKNNVKGNPKVLQLADPFLLFHYSFLNAGARVDSYGELTEENGAYTNWRGHAFELICMREIDRIKSIIGISGVRTKCYPWVSVKRNGGAQIDLVIERDDKITDICEMKCTDRPFTISKEYEDKLLNKKEVFIKETNTKNAVKIIMVSATGIKGIAHTEHISQVISMDDLFD